MSEEDRQRYHDELRHYRDVLNMLRTAREEGIEKGMQQALDRLIGSGIPTGQAKRLLGLE